MEQSAIRNPKSAILPLIKWILFLGVLAFVAHSLWSQFKLIDWNTVHFKPLPLIGAAICLLLVPPVQLLSYRTLLDAYAQAPSWRVMMAVAWVPPLGKYVPGKVASVAGAIYLLQRFKISAPIAISVVLAMDGLALVAGLMMGAGLLKIVLPDAHATVPVVLIILAGIISLHPAIFARVLNFMLVKLKHQPLDHVPDWRHYIVPVMCAFAQWLLAGLALWLVARTVADVSIEHLPGFVSIACLGYTISYLALFAPAGLGPREFIFQKGMMLWVIPAAMSAVAVVILRIVQTCTEMTAAMIGLIILRRLDRESAAAPSRGTRAP